LGRKVTPRAGRAGLVTWSVGSTSYCKMNSDPEDGVNFGTRKWGRNPTHKVGTTSSVDNRVFSAGGVGTNWAPPVCNVGHNAIAESPIKTINLEDPKHRKVQISEVRNLVCTESLQHNISDLGGVGNSAISETLNLGSSNSRDSNISRPKSQKLHISNTEWGKPCISEVHYIACSEPLEHNIPDLSGVGHP
jgi:hypothetical protein